jgi:hypothetical protein
LLSRTLNLWILVFTGQDVELGFLQIKAPTPTHFFSLLQLCFNCTTFSQQLEPAAFRRLRRTEKGRTFFRGFQQLVSSGMRRGVVDNAFYTRSTRGFLEQRSISPHFLISLSTAPKYRRPSPVRHPHIYFIGGLDIHVHLY